MRYQMPLVLVLSFMFAIGGCGPKPGVPPSEAGARLPWVTVHVEGSGRLDVDVLEVPDGWLVRWHEGYGSDMEYVPDPEKRMDWATGVVRPPSPE